jgi:hypothetical protein
MNTYFCYASPSISTLQIAVYSYPIIQDVTA